MDTQRNLFQEALNEMISNFVIYQQARDTEAVNRNRASNIFITSAHKFAEIASKDNAYDKAVAEVDNLYITLAQMDAAMREMQTGTAKQDKVLTAVVEDSQIPAGASTAKKK